MTDNSIQQARDILAKWREETAAGPWYAVEGGVFASPYTDWESGHDDFHRYVGEQAASADAALIVGTAGNPDLLDALDALLLSYERIGAHHRPPSVNRIAVAIIAANQRMTS